MHVFNSSHYGQILNDLRSDVLEERENVEIASRNNLLEHRVYHDVAASPDDRFDDFYPNCQQ